MNYKIAHTVSEALKFLQEADGGGRIIVGGTDLIIDMELGRLNPTTLVDIRRIPELQSITVENNCLQIGACVNMNQVANSPLVMQHAPALAKAVRYVGSRQTRNMATLVGNVVSARPEADGAMALSAMDVYFKVAGADGVREVPMGMIYDGKGKSSVNSCCEVVTAVCIPCQGVHEKSSYQRLQLRKAMTPSILSACIMGKVVNHKVDWVRISMGPVDVCPRRATAAEAWLAGKELNVDNISQAAQLALLDAKPLDNPFRGSKEYQKQVLPVLIKRGLIDVANQLRLN